MVTRRTKFLFIALLIGIITPIIIITGFYYDAQRRRDQEYFAKIATDQSADEAIRKDAVEKLTDQALLAKLADDPNWSVHVAAVRRIADQSTLERIAIKDDVETGSMMAVQKLTNQKLLIEIAAGGMNCDPIFGMRCRGGPPCPADLGMTPEQLLKQAPSLSPTQLKDCYSTKDQIETSAQLKRNDRYNVRQAALQRLKELRGDSIITELYSNTGLISSAECLKKGGTIRGSSCYLGQ
jgi:hypothetical protein